MSVYIKEFPLPNNCGACPLRLAWCRERIYMVTRPERCPIVPVPPHGRLIDGDKLNDYLKTAAIMADGEAKDAYIDARAEAKTMPTIIPESEDGE